MIVVAYKIPNHPSNGKSGLVIEYGFFCGGKENGGGHHDHDDNQHLPPTPKLAPKPNAALRP
ncbi:MAG: hypothetical protein NZ585_05425 [Chloracidobacterium sp.]|nr:hypothetical protein [Chloracidobacterium sp.]MDW8217641.1 hypothetical protein [Acidobacteriota bacterium]